MNNLVENQFGHGGIHKPFKTFLRALKRKGIGFASAPFDWSIGFNIESTIGSVPIKDQGINFSCGRQAGATFQFIQRKLQGINEGEISAKSGYGKYCATGGGMDVTAIETDIGAYGANLEKDVPSYDAFGQPLSESMMEEESWEIPTLTADALNRAGFLPIDVPIDMDSMATAMKTYGAIIWLIEGQNNGSWLSPHPKPPSETNPNPLWRHYMCSQSAETVNGVQQLSFYQSWGKETGDQGVQHFTEDYIYSGHILDCFTFAYKPKPLPSNQSIWASILRWFDNPLGLNPQLSS